MAEHLILYTSSSEGITIGVKGETWMEALLALTEEFGDGLLPLYERTKEELTDLSAAIAETFEEEMNEVAEELGGRITSSLTEEQSEALSIFTETADAEPEETDEEEQDEPAAVSGTGGDTVACEVCGNDTTKDHASLTRIMHGEARCPDCVP